MHVQEIMCILQFEANDNLKTVNTSYLLAVIDCSTDSLEQLTDYYPYGQLHPDCMAPELSLRKYSAKELLIPFGLDEYDFSARPLTLTDQYTLKFKLPIGPISINNQASYMFILDESARAQSLHFWRIATAKVAFRVNGQAYYNK